MNARVNFELNQPKKILLSNKDNLNKLENNFFKDADVQILKERDIKKIIEDRGKYPVKFKYSKDLML